MDKDTRHAAVWFFIGLISIPGVFFVAWSARFTSTTGIYDSALIHSIVGPIVLFYFVTYSLNRIKELFGSSFDWNACKGRIWGYIRTVVILEFLAVMTFQFDDFAAGLVRSIDAIEGEYDLYPLTGFTYQITDREVVTILILLITIPLATRLIKAYIGLLETWVSCAFYLADRLGFLAIHESTSSNGVGVSQSSTNYHAITEDFNSVASQAIHRAEIRIFSSSIAIIITAIAAIAMFQAVFESSATRRANVLIDSIENSPIAFSTEFISINRDLLSILENIRDEMPVAVETTGNTRDFVDNWTVNLPSGTKSVGPHLRETLQKLQSIDQNSASMGAETQKFISQLTELRRELEGVSSTNWDIIVVRTAIILVALVVIGIFQRILMAAIRERRSWETKLAALAMLSKTSLSEGDVESFLKIVLADPFQEPDPQKRSLKTTDVNELVNRLESITGSKPN